MDQRAVRRNSAVLVLCQSANSGRLERVRRADGLGSRPLAMSLVKTLRNVFGKAFDDSPAGLFLLTSRGGPAVYGRLHIRPCPDTAELFRWTLRRTPKPVRSDSGRN